jgi:hypothetical protein
VEKYEEAILTIAGRKVNLPLKAITSMYGDNKSVSFNFKLSDEEYQILLNLWLASPQSE